MPPRVAIAHDDTIVHPAAGGMTRMDDRGQPIRSNLPNAESQISRSWPQSGSAKNEQHWFPQIVPVPSRQGSEGMADIHGYCKGVAGLCTDRMGGGNGKSCFAPCFPADLFYVQML
ncbi:hypothetical protein BO78DRAFT_399934 [Aspergillus sclerotiicarbonarius CBS 121057]|uniref:Uncharacterized protein n=1 Tax=Aspergillus sclerotiicarbonarius (strain CBS 121057 / IBT 28362) TaxID=1448318 RepID=A0A319FB51_ASPSB|nr:hypothetical protein BO78DRAFT_399934 [Aspergillus sclerotiicarbonarius CBS 121057]